MKTSRKKYQTCFSENLIGVDHASNLKYIQCKYFLYHEDIFIDFYVSLTENYQVFWGRDRKWKQNSFSNIADKSLENFSL